MQFRRDDWSRGIRAHAAGIRPPVAVVAGLVILRSRQRQDGFAVGDDDKTGFLAVQELLDHHPPARRAEILTAQHAVNRSHRLINALGENHALARRQTIGFHYDRRADFPDIRFCRLGLGKALITGGGNAMTGQKILGKGFRAFQLRRHFRRAETAQPSLGEAVGNPQHQRHFRPDDSEIDMMRSGELE